jgi:carbon starvation protein
MDAGVRLQRYIIQEWGAIYKIPVLQNGYVATGVAVATCLLLAFGASAARGLPAGEGGMVIWPLFGTTNQLLAGLTLLVISVMLVKLGRPARYTMIPMVLITTAALAAALYQLLSLYRDGGIFYFLLWIDVIIVILAIFVLLEASSAFMRERRAAEAAAAAA